MVVGLVYLLLFRLAILCRIFELYCYLGKYPSVKPNVCQSVPLLIAFQITTTNQIYNRSTGPTWEIDWLYVCGLSWPLLAATEVWGQKKRGYFPKETLYVVHRALSKVSMFCSWSWHVRLTWRVFLILVDLLRLDLMLCNYWHFHLKS